MNLLCLLTGHKWKVQRCIRTGCEAWRTIEKPIKPTITKHLQFMYYPSMSEVKAADREQLARWHRFLPSPGTHVAGSTDPVSDAITERELSVMAEICSRFEEKGGWSPELSKAIGHTPVQ